MSNNYFQFKQFRIEQDHCAMKVGTDGVLLGAWTKVDNTRLILDIGTGTGLIALMLAQRASDNARILGIEIDKDAAKQALENVQNSPWAENVKIETISLQNLRTSIKPYLFDLIVSNPPYFNFSLKNPDIQRSLARHTDSLSYNDLISSVSILLAPSGRFTVILPNAESENFIALAEVSGLFCYRKTKVIPCIGKKEKRLLLEFTKNKKTCKDDILLIETERHKYSEQFIALTEDYYLDRKQ